jgi:hypothetical protein
LLTRRWFIPFAKNSKEPMKYIVVTILFISYAYASGIPKFKIIGKGSGFDSSLGSAKNMAVYQAQTDAKKQAKDKCEDLADNFESQRVSEFNDVVTDTKDSKSFSAKAESTATYACFKQLSN